MKKKGILRVLTVRQPWAGAIAHLGKDIENRPQRWAYRGPVLIHAGLHKPGDADWMEADEYQGVPRKDWSAMPLDFGQIIAITEVVDCVEKVAGDFTSGGTHEYGEIAIRPWFTGPYGYVLRNTQPLTPTPYTGGLGLREFDHFLVEDTTLIEIDEWMDANGYSSDRDYDDGLTTWWKS